MAFRALISVAGYDFPEPSTYSGNTATLVDSARNTEGVMIGAVIRDDVAKVEVSWRYLTIDQWASIQKCFRQGSGWWKIYQSGSAFLTRRLGDGSQKRCMSVTVILACGVETPKQVPYSDGRSANYLSLRFRG